MKKLIAWFRESDRYKHALGGFILGLLSSGFWCAALVGLSVGGALEFKDYKYKEGWDWIDFSLTAVGSVVGFTLKYLILK